MDFHHDPLPEFFAANSHGSNCLYQHGCLQVDSLIHFFRPTCLWVRLLFSGLEVAWFGFQCTFGESSHYPSWSHEHQGKLASSRHGILCQKGNAMWTALQYIYIKGRHAVNGVVQLYGDIALGFMCGCSR